MLSAKDATQAVAMMRLGAIEFCAGVCVHWTRHRRVRVDQFGTSREEDKGQKGLWVIEAQQPRTVVSL